MSETEIVRPSTLKEALKAMAERKAVAVAGGTDVLVELHDVIDRPWPKLVILEGLKELGRIAVKGGGVKLGPLLTFASIRKSAALREFAPQLTEAASIAGSVLIRNRGTLGGNVAYASPAGDLIPPLFVLSARLQLTSIKGRRYVPISEFFTGPGSTILKANELITSIELKKSGGHGFFLRLAARRALAISKVSVAVDLSLRQRQVKGVKIALGAVAPTVVSAPRTEEYLLGKELKSDVVLKASLIACTEAKPITDIRSDADYRREMISVLLRRGLSRIAHLAGEA